jgi:hypothetical protein
VVSYFLRYFLRLPPNKSPDSAGPFTSFDPVGFAIFATHARGDKAKLAKVALDYPKKS